ncbi:MAG: hypothetical protein EOO18_06860 [Chryseobacterium sp.]|nr:MAG: hypothetical protein EOO18_06860 [Chryseobacterium sp.]
MPHSLEFGNSLGTSFEKLRVTLGASISGWIIITKGVSYNPWVGIVFGVLAFVIIGLRSFLEQSEKKVLETRNNPKKIMLPFEITLLWK